MASTPVSDYLSAPEHWEVPAPNYAGLLTLVGGGATGNRSDVLAALINISARSPVAIGIVLQDDEDHVHVCHSPSIFPAEPLQARPYDDRCIVLSGNDLATVAPICLPVTAFSHTNDIVAHTTDAITGVNGHGANPAVVRTGPHAATVPDTSAVRVRKALLLPPTEAGRFVGEQASGRYTLQAFWNVFVQPTPSTPLRNT